MTIPTSISVPTGVLATGRFAIAKDDDNNLAELAYGIRAGSGGTIHYIAFDDSEDEWTLEDGEFLPLIVKRVFEDSTAGELRGLRF